MNGATPGPWRHHLGVVVADIPDGRGNRTTAVAYTGEEFRHDGGLPFGDVVQANSELIAAAPDLLEALIKIEDETKYYEQSQLRRIWEIACAAIAKVEGREP